uniref:glycosyltransferase n=1 Tax=Butyrivibrio sp. TaxID=28121 RepID=UPI0025FFE410
MKKLMLITPMLHQGGFERVCVTTARLMQKYYDVTVLIFSDKDINYDVTGLNIVNINLPSRKEKYAKVINLIKRVIKVKQLKKELGIDICYSFGSSANYVNALSKGKEKVFTGLRCSTDMESPKQVKLFCSKADQVLSCSKEIMRQLSTEYNYDKSSYIYNPLDVETINKQATEKIDDLPFGLKDRRKDSDDIKLIVSVGRQDYIKGFWHLIKAFSIIAKDNDKARLMILGTGDWSQYQKLAEDLGVKDKVAFMGIKKNPFPYVAASDMYVLSSNHEGFPNALLEAMALGKPCIAADCKTGPREIVLSEDEYNALLKIRPDGSSTDKAIEGEYGILVPDM